MTMITKEQAEALDGHTPGPWLYRPHKFDDWGVVRGGVFNEDWGGYPQIAQVRDPEKLDEPTLAEHRINEKDPWEANALLCAAAPEMRDTILALYAKLDRAREGLRPFAQEHAWGPSDRFEIVLANQYGSITGADLDNARAILKEIGE